MGTTPDPHWSPASDDFVPTAELIRRKGVGPITSVDVLGAVEDPFGSDREYADFLADLYSSRRSDLA